MTKQITDKKSNEKRSFFKEENMTCILCNSPIEQPGFYVHLSATVRCFNGISSWIEEGYKNRRKQYVVHKECADDNGILVESAYKVIYE